MCAGGVKEPLRIFCAISVAPKVPNRGKRVVIGGVSLVCLYFLSFALRIADSTVHLSWCRCVLLFNISVTSVIGGVMLS